MAKKKAHDETPEVPAELPTPEPEPEPEHGTPQVENAVEPAETPVADADDGYKRVHGADSILDPTSERSYHIRVGGQRYVHVGEHGDTWVYRPD